MDAFSQGRDRWVGADGKPPKVDAQGRLTEPFTMAKRLSDGDFWVDRWAVGVILPTPPGVLEREAAARDAKRPVPIADTGSAFKVTKSGKRKRKADAELTPQQLKRRQYNIKRNAEKKRRKS